MLGPSFMEGCMRAVVLIGLMAFTAAYGADAGGEAKAEAVGAQPQPAAAAPVAAAKPAPTYDQVVIGNDIAEATLTTNRGALVSFALTKTHPIELPRYLRDVADKAPVSKEDRKHEPLAVLGSFGDPGVDLHDWIFDNTWGLG